MSVYVITANTQGNAQCLQQELGIEPHVTSPGKEAT